MYLISLLTVILVNCCSICFCCYIYRACLCLSGVLLSRLCVVYVLFIFVFAVSVLMCDCGSLYYSRHEPPANTDAGEMPHPAGSILRSNCTSPKMEGGLGLPSSNDKIQKEKTAGSLKLQNGTKFQKLGENRNIKSSRNF